MPDPKDCPNPECHGNPFRYCPQCSWMEKQEHPILRYFSYEHLPATLMAVAKPIADLAKSYDDYLPDGAEKSAGLRKLLEAKDCLVRAALPPTPAYPLIPKD